MTSVRIKKIRSFKETPEVDDFVIYNEVNRDSPLNLRTGDVMKVLRVGSNNHVLVKNMRTGMCFDSGLSNLSRIVVNSNVDLQPPSFEKLKDTLDENALAEAALAYAERHDDQPMIDGVRNWISEAKK